MKLLGEYLLEGGALTAEQLSMGLARHAELATAGQYRFIGEILMELGFVTEGQVRWALARQQEDRVATRILM